jgi:acetylornithine deacetylase/succinyl-diaminopimelate desuccinylase-like protein
VDWRSEPAVRLLQQYLRVDSTAATGSELDAALFLATPLEAAGIPVHIEALGKHANLWAELPGEDPNALVLMSHLDVEPVTDPGGWQHPPFAGVVDPPYIHGRGSFDMKSYTVAQLLAMLELKAKHPRPRRSVILFATTGEESGSDLGTRWMLAQHPELFRRFWAVLTEGGVVEARSLDNVKYWGIEIGQKRFADLIACAPTKQRLVDLRRDILDFDSGAVGVAVSDEVRRFWEVYGSSRDRADLRQLIGDPDALPHDPARFRELPSYMRAMLRNELAPFQPEPSPGGGWRMRMIFRLLPSADLDAARRELLPPWMTAGVWLTLERVPPPAMLSSPDHPAARIIASELRNRFGDLTVGPFFLPWTATDSRFLRPLGIPSYGFSPFLLVVPETTRMGRENEKIGLPGLVHGAELYSTVVERLAMDGG